MHFLDFWIFGFYDEITFVKFWKNLVGVLGVESPHGAAMYHRGMLAAYSVASLGFAPHDLTEEYFEATLVYRGVARMSPLALAAEKWRVKQELQRYGYCFHSPPDLPFLNYYYFWKISKRNFDVFGRFS